MICMTCSHGETSTCYSDFLSKKKKTEASVYSYHIYSHFVLSLVLCHLSSTCFSLGINAKEDFSKYFEG